MPSRRAAVEDRARFDAEICALLARAQRTGVPVHVICSRSKAVNVGYMVAAAQPGENGRVALVHTQTGERFTPKPAEIRFVASVTGDVLSRPGSLSPLGATDRASAVATALSGVGVLLASPALPAAERAELEAVAASVARLSAG